MFNSHYRCHTFGIGSDVCLELVTGIASASGGACVVLKEGERLQTKVSEMVHSTNICNPSSKVQAF